jgi:hypothetical protein
MFFSGANRWMSCVQLMRDCVKEQLTDRNRMTSDARAQSTQAYTEQASTSKVAQQRDVIIHDRLH